MYFSEKITLRAVTNTRDSLGDIVISTTDTEVWANKKSITRVEFYSSSMAGIRVDVVFEVHAEDYANQELVLYDSIEYKIIRVYQRGEGIYELVCAAREVV